MDITFIDKDEDEEEEKKEDMDGDKIGPGALVDIMA